MAHLAFSSVALVMWRLRSSLSRHGNALSALLSGAIVLGVISSVLVLQSTAVGDSELALDNTSTSIRAEVAKLIAAELASLLSLVFVDAMKLSQQFKAAPVTEQTFENETMFASFVQSLFPGTCKLK